MSRFQRFIASAKQEAEYDIGDLYTVGEIYAIITDCMNNDELPQDETTLDLMRLFFISTRQMLMMTGMKELPMTPEEKWLCIMEMKQQGKTYKPKTKKKIVRIAQKTTKKEEE